MKSAQRGDGTSPVEVTNISAHGFWVLVQGRELFLPFEKFPWFQDATVSQITKVELPSEGHLYWPELDVDLTVESIEFPEKYPLVSQAQPNSRLQRTKATGVADAKRRSRQAPRR